MAIAAVILEFIDGPDRGRMVRIADFGPTLLGRGADVDIRLPAVDSSLSRHQAYIDLSRDGCMLTRVAGSSAVVEVNHTRVDSHCSLGDRDIVRLGSTVIRVGLALTDSTCLICGKTVEDESAAERDEHSDVSTQAHESCVDRLASRGERVDDYEACDQIHADSPAEQLFRVYERSMRRMWALRRLPNASLSSRARTDVQSLLAIRHPNIIRCVRSDIDATGVPFVLMEFGRGGNIAEFVHRGDYSPITALKLIDDALEGLKFLHALGRAHGNLHPGSIVVQREVRGLGTRSRAKLVDIGITNPLRGHLPSTATLRWYPPEHAPGPHEQRDDVYAIGAVLNFLLTRHPIGQMPLDVRCPTKSPQVGSIIERACHRDPAGRFRSAEHLQDALRESSDRL